MENKRDTSNFINIFICIAVLGSDCRGLRGRIRNQISSARHFAIAIAIAINGTLALALVLAYPLYVHFIWKIFARD